MGYDNEFAIQFQYFLRKIRKRGIRVENRENLYQIVQQLENRTEKQKNRFLHFYGLINNVNEVKITMTNIAKNEGCSATAVRLSIVRMISTIDNIKDERIKKALVEIINDEMKE